MTRYIDIKTKEVVALIGIINNTMGCFARVRRIRDNKEYTLPFNELKMIENK